MSATDIGILGASRLTDSGALVVTVVNPVGDDPEKPDEVETFGEVDFFNALGVTAYPYPASADGHAETLCTRHVGGSDGVAHGGRDTRTAKVYGTLAPGDTALHSTGPQQAAQVLCKEETRTVAAATKGTDGKNIVLVLNGEKDKIQIAGFGLAFEMSREQGIVLSDGAATLQIKDGVIMLSGQVVLGGRTPIAAMAACAPGNLPPGPVNTGVPTLGVFYGT